MTKKEIKTTTEKVRSIAKPKQKSQLKRAKIEGE